ncbi:hemerythrin domain-containing protein [Proteinivorax hydrogeniformans]|uniref:Hemerythrin domain-containing protein n=1 Tax=Proteinivorax hydrogeniformans TaxID=1826727 RepID=A0AAU8HWR5_9FIRM
MNAIDLMIEEHEVIKKVLSAIRKGSIKLLDKSDVDYDFFTDAIDFVRNFADKHHHGKEEDMLFSLMHEHLTDEVVKEPLSGMYAEHDLGRLFISNLEEALRMHRQGDDNARVDIIANAIGYTDLLRRHIDKEDKAIYQFALRELDDLVIKDLNTIVLNYEQENTDVVKKYHSIADELEKKVS